MQTRNTKERVGVIVSMDPEVWEVHFGEAVVEGATEMTQRVQPVGFPSSTTEEVVRAQEGAEEVGSVVQRVLETRAVSQRAMLPSLRP